MLSAGLNSVEQFSLISSFLLDSTFSTQLQTEMKLKNRLNWKLKSILLTSSATLNSNGKRYERQKFDRLVTTEARTRETSYHSSSDPRLSREIPGDFDRAPCRQMAPVAFPQTSGGLLNLREVH